MNRPENLFAMNVHPEVRNFLAMLPDTDRPHPSSRRAPPLHIDQVVAALAVLEHANREIARLASAAADAGATHPARTPADTTIFDLTRIIEGARSAGCDSE